MYEKKLNNIEDFCKEIKKGTFGLYVGTLTEPKMNVFPIGCRGSERNPYLGKLKTLTLTQNAATGVNYYTIVKSECKREGIEFTDEEFAKVFPYESTYCESESKDLSNIIMVKNDGTQKYLRLYKGRKPTKSITFYLLDGKIIDKDSDLMKNILRYIPTKKESVKQENLGIKNIVGVRQPKIENVLFMAQGRNYYVNPNFSFLESIVTTKLKEVFK